MNSFSNSRRILKYKYYKIWNHKPKDIDSLKKRVGAKNQKLTPLIYAESDTRALVKFLSYLREISFIENLDLNTLKIVTKIFIENEQSRTLRYYRMEDYAHFLGDSVKALEEIDSIQKYREVVEEILIYVGCINFWIDEQIPWAFLASTWSIGKESEE